MNNPYKKLILSFILIFSIIGNANASRDKTIDQMGRKAVRGFVNGVTGIIEFPAQIYKGYNNGVGFISNKPTSKCIGTILGIFRGTSHTIGRTGYGLVELFGFWLPNPENNTKIGIPLDADLAWEMGEQYSLFKPDFKTGISPLGNKIIRGLKNSLLGIAELPGQIRKGIKTKKIGTGIVKGIWFTLGRLTSGISETLMFFVPNPKDQIGPTFDQKDPWDALIK